MITTPAFRNRMSMRGLLLVPALVLTAAAYGQQPAGVPNFHMVNDRLYRGAQPSQEGFNSLAKLGVKTVLDLREADSRSQVEKKVVEAAGMKYVNIPLRGMHAPSHGDVAKALALLNSKDGGPVFVHCRQGVDRTGTIIACYRISHDGWDSQKALAEARTIGMHWIEKSMQHYVRDYKAPVQNASAEAVPGTN